MINNKCYQIELEKIIQEKYDKKVKALNFNNQETNNDKIDFQEIKGLIKDLDTDQKLHIYDLNNNGFYIDFDGKGEPSVNYNTKSIGLLSPLDDKHNLLSIITIHYLLQHINLYPNNFRICFLFIKSSKINTYKNMINKLEIIYSFTICSIDLGSFQYIPYGRKDEWEIIINGKGGHSSIPYLSNNPILIGTDILLRFNTMSSQEINPRDINLIQVNSFQSGAAFNVIPDTSIIKGTLLSCNESVGLTIIKRMKEICESISALNKTTFELKTSSEIAVQSIQNEVDIIKNIPANYFHLVQSDYTHHKTSKRNFTYDIPELVLLGGYQGSTDNTKILITNIEMLFYIFEFKKK